MAFFFPGLSKQSRKEQQNKVDAKMLLWLREGKEKEKKENRLEKKDHINDLPGVEQAGKVRSETMLWLTCGKKRGSKESRLEKEYIDIFL